MALSLILLLSTLTLVKSASDMFVSVSGDINYDGSNPKINLELSGEQRSIVTDAERFKFQLSDNGLKNCVRIYNGRRPTDAYVHSPTPWGDLYRSYGWNEVYRVVKPVKATVQSISTKQETISHKMYRNSQPTPGTGKASISRAYENKMSMTWSKGEEFTVGAEVSISADLKVVDVGASTSISKAKSWGQADEHSQGTTITDTAELEFTVPPKSTVYVRSEMSKTLVHVRVEYEARLEGSTAVNYKKAYQGHHFYGLDINAVMRKCGLRTELIITEENITLDMISGAKIEVIDAPSPQLFSKSGASPDFEVIDV